MANPKSCSPTNFLGQSWSNWADVAFSEESNDTESTAEAVGSGVESANRGNGRAESMKLHRTDISLFGICPSQDQFYLVVCEQCGQVVKPQGLKHHIDARHNGKAPNRPPGKMKVFKAVPSQPVPLSKHPPQRESPRRPPPQPPPVATRGSSISPSPQTEKSIPVDKHIELQMAVPLPPEPNSEMITSPVSRPMKDTKSSRLESMERNHKNQPTVLIPKISPESVWTTDSSLLKKLSPSGKSTTVPATATVATTTVTMTAVSTKKSKKKEKDSPRKFLPLKDREYDPNKHCGVAGEDGKPCLRSLTCKTHALSLRRKVPGRHKPLDKLLAERKAINASHYQQTHAAKNLSKQASGFHQVTPQLGSTISNLNVTQSSSNTIDRLHSVPKTTPKTQNSPRPTRPPDLGVHPIKRCHPHSAPSTPTTNDLKSLARSDSVGRVSAPSVESQADVDDSLSDNYLCTYQQPKPIAVCHYGSHHVGRGVYLFDRRLHSLRSSLKALIDKQLNPPPSKKACSATSLSQSETCSIQPDATDISEMILNQVTTTPVQKPTKTLSKASHSKKSKNSKSIRASAGSGTAQQKPTKSQKKNATISTSVSVTSTNTNPLITNTAIPIGGTLQLATGSSTPFLVTTNGLQNAEYIDTSLLGVDSSSNLIDQSGNLKLVFTNIEPNVNGVQPNKMNQIPIFSTIGNTPVLLQNITVGNDTKLNVKSRTKNNSKLKGGAKTKGGLAIQGGVIVKQGLLQQSQHQLVKQDLTNQDIRGFQTIQTAVSKNSSPQVNQSSGSCHMLSSNGIIPTASNIKPFLATSISSPQQQTAIVQPSTTSPTQPIAADSTKTTNFTAVLSQSGKVQLVPTSKTNSSLGKALTNPASMQLGQQITFSQAASHLQSHQLMANLITTTQQGKPIHINNTILQNHSALPTVVQGKGTSGLTLAFNQQPIFLQGQNIVEHQQQ
ncbi:uncharacterized protein [Antedon mediterranea]|uniref:uncharacterized protein isoform X2 n=1 Tax=Antedon mediterranea TaxID=105859 RepID=UPI003AF75F81